jgi:hypothetical protein
MWNDLDSTKLGQWDYFDGVMRRLRFQTPDFIPKLSQSDRLLIASDFTGDQSGSSFEVFSFVITSIEAIAAWNPYRLEIRRRYGLNNRRISYAKLGDRRKQAAMHEFAYVSNAMSGLSVTVLVNKNIASLFRPRGRLIPSAIEVAGRTFPNWRPRVFERVLRSTHLVSVFVAGLAGEMQDVTWITDEDEIAPNIERLTDLTFVFAHTLGNMLPHSVRHIRVGTTATTAGDDLAMEDLTAVADLIGGAMNDFLATFRRHNIQLSRVIAMAPVDTAARTQSVIAMLFDERAPLRKLVFSINLNPDSPAGLLFTQHRVHIGTRFPIT